MDWKKLGKKIVKMGAPLLGTAFLGPAGGALGAVVGSMFGADPENPEAIYEAIQADPNAMVKLRELQMKHREHLEELNLKHAELQTEERLITIREVNATMRAESKSEHWPQFSWRPFNGFTFPIAVVAIYFLLPALDKVVPDVPQWVWVGWLSILGVATWDRGKEKRAAAGETKTGLVAGAINAIRGK